MKTRQEIENELKEEFVAKQTDVTFFGTGGVVRGIFTSVSLVIRELWFDLTNIVRKIYVKTNSGADLDNYAAKSGLERRAGAKAGVLLLFTGADGTVIPQGTSVASSLTNLTYVTQTEITLGSKNPGFVVDGIINAKTEILGDIVWAVCSVAGAIGNAPANSINKTAIANVTVTNQSPAQGGTDQETDDEFRYRIMNYVKILNNGTDKYFEALVRDLDDRILRVLPLKDFSKPNSVKLILVTKSGTPLSQTDLTSLAGRIMERQNAFTTVTCVNVAFTLISIFMRAKLRGINNNPVDRDKYFLDSAIALSKYFDWSKWAFGGKINLSDTFVVSKSVPQTDIIDLPSYKINGSTSTSILIDQYSLPYFSSLEVVDITNSTPVVKTNNSIAQNYNNIQNID